MLEQQGLTDRRDEITDLMSHLAFGGYLSGEGMQPAGSTDGSYAGTPFRAWRLQSKEKNAVSMFRWLRKSNRRKTSAAGEAICLNLRKRRRVNREIPRKPPLVA